MIIKNGKCPMRHRITIKIQELHEPREERRADSNSGEKQQECLLRFPFFNKVWNGGNIDEYEGDALDHFPETYNVRAMISKVEYNKFSTSPGDNYFWGKLKSCPASEIYFLDSYFSAANLARLLNIANSMDCQIDRTTTHIVIYTCVGDEWKKLKNEFGKRHAKYLCLEKMTITICCVEKSMASKMHDRFALLGNLLWHFGASAGAMHTNINAYSGPWLDKDGKCMEFMRDLHNHHVVDEVSTTCKEMGND